MSIHAQLSPEALQRLHTMQRNSTVASIIIALLTVLLIGILLLYLLLPATEKFTPEIATYISGREDASPVKKCPLSRAVRRTPVAPVASASTVAKTLVASTASAIAIPVPVLTEDTPTPDFTSEDTFDDGWGETWELGNCGGFGSTTKLNGTISGYLYDFKQTPLGEPVKRYNIANTSHFTKRINSLHRSRYSPSALRRYYRTQQQLHIRYIAIPFSDASEGPRFFNAAKEIKPSGWIAHYSGRVVAPKDGTFRFVGAGDDYLSVTVNKKFRLVATWSDIKDTVAVRGANAKEQPNHRSPLGTAPLTYGDWFSVKRGQELDLSITLGERPGGKVGFVLMLEEKGTNYRTTPTGQPVLPPFAVGALSPQDISELKKFPGWEWQTNNIPIFHAK